MEGQHLICRGYHPMRSRPGRGKGRACWMVNRQSADDLKAIPKGTLNRAADLSHKPCWLLPFSVFDVVTMFRPGYRISLLS